MCPRKVQQFHHFSKINPPPPNKILDKPLKEEKNIVL